MDKEFRETLLKYIFYNIVGMVCISLYILVDTYFIAYKLGSIGLVASNLALPIYTLNNALGLMLGIGYGNRYNNLRSLDREDKSLEVLREALIVGLLLGLIFTFVGIFFADALGLFLGTNTDTHTMTLSYLRSILICSPIFIINNIVIVFCKNDDHPKVSMFAMIVSALANGSMDYIFMFIFNMGMFGAALATCLAAFISAVIVLGFHFFLRYKNLTKILLQRQKLKLDAIKDGVPSFVVEISSGILMYAFNRVILKINGNNGVAAYGVITNVYLVVLSIYNGLSQGIQPLISRSFIRGEKDNLKSILTYSIFLSLLISTIIYFALFVFAKDISLLYLSDGNTEAASLSISGIKLYFIGTFFVGLNLISIMYLSITKRVRQAFVLSLLRSVILSVISVVAFGFIMGMKGVWLSFVFTELLTLLWSYLFIKNSRSKN